MIPAGTGKTPTAARRIAGKLLPGKRLLALCLAVTGLALGTSGTGCVNSRLSSQASGLLSSATSGTGTTGPSGTSGVDSFAIGNVTIAVAPTGAAGAAPATPPTTIFFDPSHSTSAGGVTTPPIISTHCSAANGTGGNAKPCVCQFQWSEVNSSTGNNQPFTRTVQQPVTTVQQELLTCNAPDVYNTEIGNGTTIKVTVLPASGNSDIGLFTVNTFNYVKNTVTTAGSFQDAEGNAFDNIVHYSCYEQFQIGSVIMSKMGTATNATTGEVVNYPIANQFCIQGSTGAGGSPSCPMLPSGTTNSAQAYYYNFFIRASQSGDVNQWNDRYTCPSVKEPIYNAGGVGTQGGLYPMDTNFALSMGSTPQFNVGVNGFVELSDGGADPISVAAQTCDGNVPAGNSSTSGFVQACLGYAAPPASDGTCPSIRDSSGAIRFTYRLRRFIALYPPLFGINGMAPTTPQRTDSIYVLDRPVTPPSGANPLQPYTMRGPKPCPFALFDSKGVMGIPDTAYTQTGGYRPAYGATNNSSWNGKNVDGVMFPNTDGQYSCSTALPLVLSNELNPDLTTITIGTINAGNPVLQSVYVRPIHSWAPHYEEDTSFQACAPQASPVHDPPLHFAKDLTTGNVSWCAEVYPSQNDHVASLDQLTTPNQPMSASNPYIGRVLPYTSHVAKNSNSATCTATIPSSIPSPTSGGAVYPPASTGACLATNTTFAGVAYHPANLPVDSANVFGPPVPHVSPVPSPLPICASNTCDRTAIISGGVGWQEFPLLATPTQVEQAISSDTTYGCVVTYDAGGPATGKKTPSGGCCGTNVNLQSGFTSSSGTTAGMINTTAHLEPDAPCLIPAY